MLLNAVAFIVVFGVMVLAHEWGHFIVARLAGIQVEEFGLGYPPRVKTLAVRNGTEYTLNAIPFGGFVRLSGENDADVPGGFASRGAWVRISTLLAGPLMNLVLAAVFLVSVAMIGEQVAVGKVVLRSVAPNSPAEQAGMRPGDVVLALEGQEIRTLTDLLTQTQAFVGQEVSVSLQRGDQHMTVRLTPRAKPPAGEGAMGVVIGMQEGYKLETVRYPIWEAIPLGIREVWTILGLTVSGLLSLFRVGLRPESVAGPVGIFQLSGEVARTGIVNLMRFTAVLSTNLFIINLVPLPVLDGGQVAFVLFEKLRGGKRVAPQQADLVRIVSWLLLLSLMLLVSYFDILRLFSGVSPLP